jgi:hypothetical protein
MSDRKIPYGLGKTAVSGETTHLLGHRAFFADVDVAASGAKPVLTALVIEALWVKNNSGGALLPAEIASWDAGANSTVGKNAGAKAGAITGAAGVVDPYLPAAGVANLDHFWLITKGPTTVIHAGNDTIVRGNGLVTGAAGRVDLYEAGAADPDDAVARFGRAIDTPANNNAGTKFRALVDFRN